MIEQYQYSNLGPLKELSNIYIWKQGNKVSSLKSINKFQSTTNEKFKQNMNLFKIKN